MKVDRFEENQMNIVGHMRTFRLISRMELNVQGLIKADRFKTKYFLKKNKYVPGTVCFQNVE